MEILAKEKNCLGTMSFTLKIGRMKKAEEFCTYPIQRGDNGDKLCLQSSHRWAELNTRTGAVEMSARHSFSNSMSLFMDKLNGTAESDKANEGQLEEILSAVRGTASAKAGGNNVLGVFCDNSNASLV